MKKVFIINPKIHWKKQVQWMKSIKSAFQGEDILIEKTKGSGYAQNIAQKYALEAQNEPVHIFSCGGDGILHEWNWRYAQCLSFYFTDGNRK